jgi:hypothetical protein
MPIIIASNALLDVRLALIQPLAPLVKVITPIFKITFAIKHVRKGGLAYFKIKLL